jgi:hypothetical protein
VVAGAVVVVAGVVVVVVGKVVVEGPVVVVDDSGIDVVPSDPEDEHAARISDAPSRHRKRRPFIFPMGNHESGRFYVSSPGSKRLGCPGPITPESRVT